MKLIRKLPGVNKLGKEAALALYEGCELRGWDFDALIVQIWTESGFDPAILTYAAKKDPRQTASGLIQLIGANVKWLVPKWRGLTNKQAAANLRKMSSLEQVPLIFKFYETVGQGAQLKGADFRILGYGGGKKTLDAPDDYVLYGATSDAAKLNPGAVQNGIITVGSVRREVARRTEKAENYPMEPIENLPTLEKAKEVSQTFDRATGHNNDVAIILGVFLILWVLKKGSK
jgi:hypothetical protein